MPSRRRAQHDLRFQISNLNSTACPASPRPRLPAPRAFTLLELLVVIGIIVLLAAILVPVVSQVRMKSYVTVTTAQMNRIATAIQSYYHDFKSYPGPLANSSLVGGQNASNNKMTMGPAAPKVDPTMITSSENLVLGLFGCLNPPVDPTDPSRAPQYMGFPPPHDVLNLNPVRPASYHYIDYIPEELSVPTGYAYAARLGNMDGKGSLNTDVTVSGTPPANSPNAEQVGLDTAIPEFMDRIPDYMPILYIRANVGAQGTQGDPSTGIASATPNPSPPVQYDASQLSYYGFGSKNNPNAGPSTVDYPLPTGVTASGPDAAWIAYFMNPNMVGQPRGKDGFVLISAGPDRLYGTKDDIIVTP